MKLVLKIATGVFLGILAVLFVRAIPNIVTSVRESRASAHLNNLTPDVVIARCGKPLKDARWNMDPGSRNSVAYRYLYYGGDRQPTILVKFSQLLPEDGTGDTWHLYTIAPVSSLDDTSGEFQWDADRDKLSGLPCLANK